MTPLTQLPAPNALQAHYESLREAHLRDLFVQDPQRGDSTNTLIRRCRQRRQA